jgi:putative flippase GtrA
MIRNLHLSFKKLILNIIDFFYPSVQSFIPLKKFRYLFCGGANTALNIILYYISYNFFFKENYIQFFSVALSRHIASFWLPLTITFPLGFYLSMFVVFNGSYLKREVQFFRYVIVVALCIIFNYTFLKFFVEEWRWYPPFSSAVSTALIVTFSYLSQMYFSFKGNHI